MASSSSAAGASAALGGKRPVADPRGPVLELLQGYGVTDRGYYDNKIRGKLLRFDNIKQLAAGSSGGRGKGAGRGSGYGGGRHRRAAEAAAEAQAEASGTAVGSSKAKGRERGFQYEDFGPLRDLWAAYMQDLRAGLGAGCDASALGELLASADLHGSTIEVVQATTPGCVRLRGTVIEETQRTFKIITEDNKTKMLPKTSCVFEIEAWPGERLRLLGPAWTHRLPHGVPGALPGTKTPSRWKLGPGPGTR
eukprot:TRINITY_DN27761_c0_g1_i2.p1 TRINITY_DN27761_c0_g1~~TRINITY_DN27761_c0_g1_i2.p1  ORF type:complete len:251 (+),score=57.09 TRINITY_DN27761_c0_g1_i2:44-796(+)